ncbi:MAG: pilus assembly protein PilM [Phycisphaerae bacterium]|nr:pilus assembly protein PilM [Phycisphaerae bacterium]
MFFSSLKQPLPPIAVDFGVSRLKVLQLSHGPDGGGPQLLGAAMRATPPELMSQPGARLEFQAAALGELVKSGAFKGKRAVCSVSAAHTVVQHLQVTKTDGKPIDAQVHDELGKITGRDASQFILRHTEVCEVNRGGVKRTEVICLAMPRDVVMAHMKALRHARLEAVGIHAEHTALVKSLARLSGAGEGAEAAQMLIDVGGGVTKVAVSSKGALRLAKVLSIGGRDLFRSEAKAAAPANSKLALRAQLEALESDDGSGVAVLEKPAVATLDTVAADSLAEEVQQCMRYYHALAPDRKIERVIFAGGESSRPELCKRLARGLGVPAQVADVLVTVPSGPGMKLDGVALEDSTPEWAVALGLCMLPTEA